MVQDVHVQVVHMSYLYRINECCFLNVCCWCTAHGSIMSIHEPRQGHICWLESSAGADTVIEVPIMRWEHETVSGPWGHRFLNLEKLKSVELYIYCDIWRNVVDII